MNPLSCFKLKKYILTISFLNFFEETAAESWVPASDFQSTWVLLGRSNRWPGGAGRCGNAGWVVRGEDQLPGERPLRDRARDKCSPRPLFRGIISTLLICCSIHIHTRLPWMEREREAEIGGTREVEGQDREMGGRWRQHDGNLFPDKPSFEKRETWAS